MASWGRFSVVFRDHLRILDGRQAMQISVSHHHGKSVHRDRRDELLANTLSQAAGNTSYAVPDLK